MKTTHLLKRQARKAVLTVAGPIDRVAMLINGKRGLPPVALRRQNGPLAAYERVAGEYVAYLVTLAGLAPDSRVLDVGCGAGAMPLVLQERLDSRGRYVGFEVDRPTLAWCERHLGNEQYQFFHHDYWNATYNPAGQRELAWPIDAAWADVVLLKSIFTHMLPPDVALYVREIARTLAPGGTALVTAFLYNAGTEAMGRHSFPFKGEHYRWSNPASPESAIALDRTWLESVADQAGLTAEVLPGLWREDRTERPYAYQDMVLLRHS